MEERELRTFDNKELGGGGRMCGHKKKEVTEGQRNEDLLNLFSLTNVIS
jgi:hypothetical protein